MKIIPVILAGGSGTRLWPLSRQEHPKQFVKLCGELTLFQDTLMRLKNFPNVESPIIVCSQGHKELIMQQLAEIGISNANLILEPIGRNTAPAVAMAAMLALDLYPNSLLLVLPADHAISNIDSLHEAITNAQQYAGSGHLVCFGITPSRPETGYGYIKVGERLSRGEGFYIDKFIEKPNQDLAQEYLQSQQYYWNSGMFMFGAQHYLQELASWAKDIFIVCEEVKNKSRLDGCILQLAAQEFANCRSDSIDYAVMEHAQRAIVVPLNVGWSDVGSWLSLWDYKDKDQSKNVVIGNVVMKDCSESYIHSTKRKIVAIGVENLVVVEMDDVVLIMSKDQHQHLKEMHELINKLE